MTTLRDPRSMSMILTGNANTMEHHMMRTSGFLVLKYVLLGCSIVFMIVYAMLIPLVFIDSKALVDNIDSSEIQNLNPHELDSYFKFVFLMVLIVIIGLQMFFTYGIYRERSTIVVCYAILYFFLEFVSIMNYGAQKHLDVFSVFLMFFHGILLLHYADMVRKMEIARSMLFIIRHPLESGVSGGSAANVANANTPSPPPPEYSQAINCAKPVTVNQQEAQSTSNQPETIVVDHVVQPPPYNECVFDETNAGTVSSNAATPSGSSGQNARKSNQVEKF